MYYDPPPDAPLLPDPQPVTLTRIDVPTRDILIFLLRLNAAQLLITLLFGVPAYLLMQLLVNG
jgi:hypothetical protein